MEFAYSNGSDALALTDHGNMNGLSYQVLHAKKMKAEGKDFKPIFGCEAYFLPSIEKWREEYDQAMLDKKKARAAKKAGASGATVEDEGASKGKNSSVLRRRRHLVLLAQNQTGLNNSVQTYLRVLHRRELLSLSSYGLQTTQEVWRRHYCFFCLSWWCLCW
jgi:DNA polymerase III alpha subunit